jgi:hypothetical protein
MPPSRLSDHGSQKIVGKLAVILAGLAASLGLTAPAALAAGPGVIVKVHQASHLISPYFKLQARAGSSVAAGSLELVNPTGQTERVTLHPVDSITTSTLGSAYALQNAGIHGPTRWLRLGRRTVTLAGHGRRSVPVSLAVPATARPGDYLAGVAVQALDQSPAAKVTSGVSIGEIDRYAIGVELTIPGARHPALVLTGATVTRQPAGLAFLVSARNTGNVILKNVHGWVRVTSGSRRVAAATIQPGTFVTATSINYPLPAFHEQPTPGASYRVKAALYYSGGLARLDRTVVFSHAAAVTQQNYGGRKLPHSTPAWRWALVALAILAAVPALYILVRRRRRPLNRTAGLRLLERWLAADSKRPISIARVATSEALTETIAAVIGPRLRRADRICDLGAEGLLVICPATSDRAAAALREDLLEQLARHPEVADVPIQIAVATASAPMRARQLLARAANPELYPVAASDGERRAPVKR